MARKATVKKNKSKRERRGKRRSKKCRKEVYSPPLYLRNILSKKHIFVCRNRYYCFFRFQIISYSTTEGSAFFVYSQFGGRFKIKISYSATGSTRNLAIQNQKIWRAHFDPKRILSLPGSLHFGEAKSTDLGTMGFRTATGHQTDARTFF